MRPIALASILLLMVTAFAPLASAGPASDALFFLQDTSCRQITMTSAACDAYRDDLGALGLGICGPEPTLAGNEAIWLLWAIGTASDSATGGQVCLSAGERAEPVASAADAIVSVLLP